MPGLFSLSRPRRNLQRRQPSHRLIARCPTHLQFRPQRRAERGALRLAEQPTSQVVVQLYAGHARRFAVRHAGDGRGDRGRDAAGTAA